MFVLVKINLYLKNKQISVDLLIIVMDYYIEMVKNAWKWNKWLLCFELIINILKIFLEYFWRYRHECQTIYFNMTCCKNQWDLNQLSYGVIFCCGREKTYCISRFRETSLQGMNLISPCYCSVTVYERSFPKLKRPKNNSNHTWLELSSFHCSFILIRKSAA